MEFKYGFRPKAGSCDSLKIIIIKNLHGKESRGLTLGAVSI